MKPMVTLTCGFGTCALVEREPEDMVEHLETVHKDDAAALEIANQIRATLKESEADLLQFAQLDGYQATVFIGLTQALQPPYSDTQALELIAKHKDMIAERERRHFLPYATTQTIHEAELVTATPSDAAIVRALYDALRKARETIRTLNGIGMKGEAEQLCWEAYQHSPEMKEINAAIALVEGDKQC